MELTTELQFHVLAVDDSLVDRKLIERLLKTSSFLVTTINSGRKALKFLGLGENNGSVSSSSSLYLDAEVNMVITDYCMPAMSGYDLLKKIKESSALRNIPVVIMSSENVPARINRCLDNGAEEFLRKPVKLSDMKMLRPHILKGKYEEQQRKKNINDDLSSSCSMDLTNANTIINASSNKRKAVDERLSSERKRAGFSRKFCNRLAVL